LQKAVEENSDWRLDKIFEEGSVQAVQGIPEDIKSIFRTSLKIPWNYHIEHQAAFQKYTDNAVSKTINMPTDATLSDVESAFIAAWKSHCKEIPQHNPDGSSTTLPLTFTTCPYCFVIATNFTGSNLP
jgi:ribonucleoside-diphosphate reductase alpha chain